MTGTAYRFFAKEWLLPAASMVVPALALGGAAASLWDQASDQTVDDARRTTEVMREHTLHVLNAERSMLSATVEHIRGRAWRDIIGTPEVHRFLKSLDTDQSDNGGISLIAPDHRLADHSRFDLPVRRNPLWDREYVRKFALENHYAPDYYVGEVVISRATNMAVYTLSSPTLSRDGTRDGGLVTANNPVGLFQDFFTQLAIAGSDELTLFRDDGAVLARPGPKTGGSLGRDDPLMRLAREAAKGTVVTAAAKSPQTGQALLYGVAKVGSYPLYVGYGRSLTSVRCLWLRQLLPSAAIALLSALGLSLLSLLALARSRSAADALRREAEASDREARAREALQHSTRLATLGQLSASIAHEISQPLNASVSCARAGLRWLDRSVPDLVQVKESLVKVSNAAEHASAIIKNVRRLAKKGPSQHAPFDMGSAIDGVLVMQATFLKNSGITVLQDVPIGSTIVMGDQVQVQQVIMNIVTNAVEAMAETSGYERVLRISRKVAGNRCEVRFTDNGPGLAEAPEKLLEIFYSTKDEGLGLGLPISRAIMVEHGSDLLIEPHRLQGLSIVISFNVAYPARS